MTPENIGSPIRSIPSSASGAAAAPTAFRDFRQLVGIPVSIANLDTVCPHVNARAGIPVAGSSTGLAQPARLTTTTIHNPAKLIGSLPGLPAVVTSPSRAGDPAALLMIPKTALLPLPSPADARDAVIAAAEAPIDNARQSCSAQSSLRGSLDTPLRTALASGSAATRLAAMALSQRALNIASPMQNQMNTTPSNGASAPNSHLTLEQQLVAILSSDRSPDTIKTYAERLCEDCFDAEASLRNSFYESETPYDIAMELRNQGVDTDDIDAIDTLRYARENCCDHRNEWIALATDFIIPAIERIVSKSEPDISGIYSDLRESIDSFYYGNARSLMWGMINAQFAD